MIKIHSNIIIGSPNDLTQLLNSVHYVVNCSISLNNLYVHPNYINLNIVNFSNDSLQILNSIFDFINWKILSNQNIFLLCENGISNSLMVGMFFMMKLHVLNYNDVYYRIATIHRINSHDFYSGLKYYEPYIIKCEVNDKMDTT